MIERVNVQVFIFKRNPKFQLLILKRTAERGGWYQPISGGIEKNETTLEAIKREIFEETGIENIKNFYDLNYNFTFTAPISKKKMMDICFAIEIDNLIEIRLSQEHEKYIWCTEKQAKELLKWKYNLIALDILLEILKREQKL